MDLTIYNELIDNLFENIEQFLEKKFDHIIDDIDITEYELYIILNNDQKYLLNKHNTTMNLWLSSPISGGHQFEYNIHEKKWCNKHKQELFTFLEQELATVKI